MGLDAKQSATTIHVAGQSQPKLKTIEVENDKTKNEGDKFDG